MLMGQSLALASQEESHHATDHCCLLCHAGPLPFLQTTVAATRRCCPLASRAVLPPHNSSPRPIPFSDKEENSFRHADCTVMHWHAAFPNRRMCPRGSLSRAGTIP